MNNRTNHSAVISDDLAVIEEVFQSLGLSWKTFTRNKLPLLNLPEEIKEALLAGQIEYTKAKTIASVETPQARKKLLEEALDNQLTLREIQKRVAALKNPGEFQSLHSRLDSAYRHLKKSPAWSDPMQKAQLEKLLQDIENIINKNAQHEWRKRI